jgi:hypothetical protein
MDGRKKRTAAGISDRNGVAFEAKDEIPANAPVGARSWTLAEANGLNFVNGSPQS